ncbi:natural killer cell receptor 2B4-like [Antechinus flavipes]|uniref:natural killer cell receptor 2B4-like n=1 Tax=Antechinus flavipes TaxID=38775 RepID=UPI002236A5EE|nr:natural killer cell receptor 2B4-like [Antechinus flavipes]
MLWKTFTPLLFLVLLQNQGTPGSDMSINVIMGGRIQLQPIWSQEYSSSSKFTWFVTLSSSKQTIKILSWETDKKMKCEAKQFKDRAHIQPDNLTLFINSAQKNDSGCYYMQITSQSGQTFKSTSFQVSVFDPVQAPQIQVTGKSWNNTLCHVNLSCFVPGNSNLVYTWYRGRERIKTSGKHAHVQLYIQANTENFYSCNASNPVSSASHTTNLAQACASPDYRTSPGKKNISLLNITSFLILSASNLAGQDKSVHSSVQFSKHVNLLLQDEYLYVYISDFSLSLNFQQPFPNQVNSNSSHPVTIYQEVQKFNRLSSKELEIFQLYS